MSTKSILKEKISIEDFRHVIAHNAHYTFSTSEDQDSFLITFQKDPDNDKKLEVFVRVKIIDEYRLIYLDDLTIIHNAYYFDIIEDVDKLYENVMNEISYKISSAMLNFVVELKEAYEFYSSKIENGQSLWNFQN